jgi:hypothetical protein
MLLPEETGRTGHNCDFAFKGKDVHYLASGFVLKSWVLRKTGWTGSPRN